MARNDDSQRSIDAPSRVYKSSDVHKRRVDRKGREKKGVQPPEAGVPSRPEMPEESEPAKSAVVIAPEFGKRTEAQRQADDRWFAAMREGDDHRGRDDAGTMDEVAESPLPAVSAAVSSGDGQLTQRIAPQPASTPSETPSSAVSGDTNPKIEHEPVSAPSSESGASPTSARVLGSESASEPEAAAAPGQAQASDGESDVAQLPDGEGQRPSIRVPSTRKGRIALVIGLIVLVAAVVASVLFVWNRWYRFDDHGDMQGTWYVVGTTVPVSIDETAIHLTSDVTYQYAIDDHDKTIRYSLGPMEGQGRYWFSDDRQYLVITDGNDYSGTSTAVDDLLRMFSEMPDKVTGNEVKLPEGEGIIAFSREPDAATIARQKEEAAAKAAAEAAARQEAEKRAAEQAAAEAAEAAAWEESSYEEEASAEDQGGSAEEGSTEEPPANEEAPEGAPEEAPADGDAAEQSPR